VPQYDHIYRVIELAGTSKKSVEDAIATAITRANKTIRDLWWFEVVQTRGDIENGSIERFQVTLKVGFTMGEPS
jgi:flavin-binding protein dodecin